MCLKQPAAIYLQDKMSKKYEQDQDYFEYQSKTSKNSRKPMKAVYSTNTEHMQQEIKMLNWIITFFLMAVVAAILGFGGLAGTFAEIAKFLAVMFVILFVASLIYSLITGRRPAPPVL